MTAALVVTAINANVDHFYAGLYDYDAFKRLNHTLWDLAAAWGLVAGVNALLRGEEKRNPQHPAGQWTGYRP